jgi:hypothetical protein
VIIGVLFYIFISILLFFSLCSTSHITTTSSIGNEVTLYVKDHVSYNLIAFITLLLLFLAVKKTGLYQFLSEKLQNEATFTRWKRLLLICIFLLGSIWILSTQYLPSEDGDQLYVQQAIYSLNAQNYSMFNGSGYVGIYPNQIGIIALFYLLSFIFGSYNYILFELLNVCALVCIYNELSEFGKLMGMEPLDRLLTLLLGILFFPLTMYTSFLYGNLLGLAFALIALRFEILYFSTYAPKNAFLSLIAIVIAISFKSNYLIFFIAMFLYAAVELFCRQKKKIFLYICLLIAALVLQHSITTAVIEKKVGHDLSSGVSSWSWIAMGLQESYRAPGWYNGYNISSYQECNYDSDLQAELAKENIWERLLFFYNNRSSALEFFTRKTASQWNNPTFQCFANIQNARSSIAPANWVYQFTSVYGSYQWERLLNILQFLILGGAFFFILSVFSKGNMERNTWLYAMIFIGGFLFHLFWEAKCQYTITYFVLLFPYSVMGYQSLSNTLLNTFSSEKRAKKDWGIPVAVICTMLWTMGLYGGKVPEYLTSDLQKYNQYLEDSKSEIILGNGTYQIFPSRATERYLAYTNGTNDEMILYLSDEGNTDHTNTIINAVNYQGKTQLYFTKNGKYITLYDRWDESKQHVYATNAFSSSDQNWIIVQASDVGFHITDGQGNALTYDLDTGEIYLSPYTGEFNQHWYAKPAE